MAPSPTSAPRPEHPGAVPTIDLSPWSGTPDERAALAGQVVRACHEVGFFHLTGHGVEQAFLDRYLTALESFFALDPQVKARIEKINSPHFRGWERVGSELTGGRVDHREQLDLSSEHPPHPPGTGPAYLRLDGPNQWLAEDVLPGFRAVVTEFLDRMGALAEQIMAVMATGLGLEPDTFVGLFGPRPHSLAKLISYPPTPAGEAGVNAHHDAGFLTILLQHGVEGLQAQLGDGSWVDVTPLPGAFVINTGEMLQTMTGNYVVAATHRVVTTRARFSSAYFHGPDLRTELTPLPLDTRFAAAVAASPRHAGAGFMARAEELEAGLDGIGSTRPAAVYGEQLWNYYRRSYPANMTRHHAG